MALLTRLRLLAGLLLCLLLAPMPAAFAHAQLLSTNPAADAVVASAPGQVELTFNEPVTPLAIRLIGPDGAIAELTEQTTGGETTTISLPGDLADGTQVLSWRVVSTDGHPIGGSLVFSIGTVTGAAAVDTAADPIVSASLWAAKALLFIALFIGVGGAAFSMLAELPPAARRTALLFSVAGLVIAPVTLALQGLDALGRTWVSVLDPDVCSAALSTSYGATAIAAAIAFILAAVALAGTGRRARYAGAAAGAVAALSLALSGHASAAEPQWLMRPAVFLHIAAILFWTGALLPLWYLLRNGNAPATRALAAFSRAIPFAVLVLVLSGATLAFVQLGTPGPQWVTGYGIILAAKLLLLALLLALALWNRNWLTAPALAGDRTAQGKLRHSITAEMVIVVLILALVAGWRFTPPPRALAMAPVAALPADPIMEHFIDGTTMAMVIMDPGSAGTVRLDTMVLDLEHSPRDAMSVAVIIASPELGIEPIRRDAIEADGMWTIEELTIPIAGTWQVEVEIRLSRFELARPRGEIVVP